MGRWYRDSMVALKANDWMTVVETLRETAKDRDDEPLQELANYIERQASLPGPPPEKGARPA